MSAPCPPQEQLEQLLDDRPEAGEDSVLARHVESCAQCRDRLERLLADSLSSLGQAQTNPEMADSLLVRLKKRGRRDEETIQVAGTQPLAKGPADRAASLPEVPGYEVLGEIGRGGMGVVYKARQISLNRMVALKMISAGPHAGSAEVLARFRNEAEAVARLHHPNIVQIHEVGEHQGLPFFSLELVEGKTLRQQLAGKTLPTPAAAQLLEILARAIHVAHLHGIIHRDLKPDNILLAAGQAVQPDASASVTLEGLTCGPKIADFGLAKRLDEDGGQTQTGQVLGTPNYMSPEQADGRTHSAGPPADVYALGAILYECLTGRPPFQGATVMDTLYQLLNEEPVRPGLLRPNLPRDLEQICLKCLEKDPRKRYASALDLAEDLRRHLEGESVHARPASTLERMWRWSWRNPLPASLLLAVSLGSAFGFWHLSGLSRSLVESAALDSAAHQSKTLEEVNGYYSEVVAHLQKTGTPGGRVVASHRWREKPDTVPLPATMTIELGKRITDRKEIGVEVRLYSDYPFLRSRHRDVPLDDFQKEALADLRKGPDQPVFRIMDYKGRPVVRYATARRMKQACIDCHNTHPDSPKTDWRVGDVRGVMEIIRPLDADEGRIQAGLRGTLILVTAVSGGLLAVSALAFFLGRRRPRLPS